MATKARRVEIASGARVRLKDFDPADTGGLQAGAASDRRMRRDIESLADLHQLLYAAQSHSVLIVLQGIDTAGKDGTIRHVFTGVNPQGCRVVAFREPTPEEAAHDYLWRVHRETPGLGEIAIFNRSHYESVLVERVHQTVPKAIWKKRYDEINAFEEILGRAGTIVLKFFLHISKSEQKRRLRERLADPDKRWKASAADWKERRLWKDYREAFEEMLSKTSTSRAPWFVIPSDVKWYRNLLVAKTIVHALRPREKQWRETARRRGKDAAEPDSRN